jgi:hypothetical protein
MGAFSYLSKHLHRINHQGLTTLQHFSELCKPKADPNDQSHRTELVSDMNVDTTSIGLQI